MRAFIIFWLLLTSATAADYLGRLAAEQKGGDSSLVGEDSHVSPSEKPGIGSAPADTPAAEASEGRFPLPDDPAPQPFSLSAYVHDLESVGYCTASCVYLGDGLFLTAKHVFDGVPNNTPIKIDGKQYGGTRKRIDGHDIAIMQMNKIPADWPAATISIEDPRKNPDPVTLYGMRTKGFAADYDTEEKFEKGVVGYNLQDVGPGVETVDNGDSGGAVFNSTGQVVGVISCKITNVFADGREDPVPYATITALHDCHHLLPPRKIIPEDQQAHKPPTEAMDTSHVKVLLFSAAWCGPCRTVKQTILPQIEKAGYKVAVVDTDSLVTDAEHPVSGRDLSIQYDIMALPTWVILKDGKEVHRETYGNVTTLLQHCK